MIVGMDFGTTNSGMATYDGDRVRLLPLDPSNPNPRVVRTALYITKSQEFHIGRAAVDLFFRQNLNRPVKMERIWIGELMHLYSDNLQVVQDVYALEDVLAPGRLFLSVKSNLPLPDYHGTTVEGAFWALEDLIATYLYVAKERAEKLLRTELSEIVLGRPVQFSPDAAIDRLAQERLVTAAFRAGYRQVAFELEPIAAAFHYGASLTQPENVLVFDFGGGTLDITVARLGAEQDQILATGGVSIGGDKFDQKIVLEKFPPHFGAGTFYRSANKDLPMPPNLYENFDTWQAMMALQTASQIEWLERVRQTAYEPDKIAAFIGLVSSNTGIKMFDVAEQAKRVLSDSSTAPLTLVGPGVYVQENLSREFFQQIIRPEVRRVEELLNETLTASGLRAGQIQAVICTGGSSQIPVFRALLEQKFGADKVRNVDLYSSVTSGLAIAAHRLERGSLHKQVYRADEWTHRATAATVQAGTLTVNLQAVKNAISLHESQESQMGDTNRRILAVLGADYRFTTHIIDLTDPASYTDVLADGPPPRQLVATTADDSILFATSRSQFFLMTVRQLLMMVAQGKTVYDLPTFAQGEVITALARWSEIEGRDSFVVVTAQGFARTFDVGRFSKNVVGAPRPWRLTTPLPGHPRFLLGTIADDTLTVVTGEGRVARMSPTSLSVHGGQAIRWGEAEVIAAFGDGDRLLMATSEGQLLTIPLELVAVTPKVGAGAKVSRSPVIAAQRVPAAPERVWTVREGQIAPLSPTDGGGEGMQMMFLVG